MYHSSCTHLKDISNYMFWRFFNSFDTVVTCCEGVLWNSEREINEASITLNRLRDVGKQIFFFTNNISRTRGEVVTFAEKTGIVIHKNEVITSSFLTAFYLKNKNFNGTAYVIGSRDLASELDTYGITHIGTGPDPPSETVEKTYELAEIEPNVKAVVVGLDEHFCLTKLVKAASYLQDPDCEFVALDSEERKSGYRLKAVPGCGAILAAVETCTGREAKILGKPSTYIVDYLREQHCIEPQRTLFIGDRLKLDVILGQKCGFQTLLVLSGMTQPEDLHMKLQSKCSGEESDGLFPDLYTTYLDDMLPFLSLKN